jgi:hypothetical protein
MEYAADTMRLGEYVAEARKSRFRVTDNKIIVRILFGMTIDPALDMRQNARNVIIESRPT